MVGIRLLIALAAGVAGPLAAQEMTQRDQDKLDWGTFKFEPDAGLTNGVILTTADSAFQALRRIVDELGISLKKENLDPQAHQINVGQMKLVRRLGKYPVSRFLSCGNGFEGPNADVWYVYLNMRLRATPVEAAKSRLNMAVSAYAIDVPAGRSDRVICSTTGVLELEIVKRLRAAFPTN